MKTVWVYRKALNELDDIITFDIPEGARILSVANQHEKLAVYAEVESTNKPRPRSFLVAGTGHPLISERATFVGTALFMNGNFVLHVYDLGG